MKYLISILISFSFFALQAQDSRLAYKYLRDGEYEKASTIFKKLYEKDKTKNVYFSQYIKSLLELEDFNTAESEIESELKSRPNDVTLYVTLGNLQERMMAPDKAEKSYRRAINQVQAKHNSVINLGNTFSRLAKFDLALETYHKGASLLDNDVIFAYYLADLYRRKGDTPKMIEFYLNYCSDNVGKVRTLKKTFQTNLQSKDDLKELKTQLYERINQDPDNRSYPELLQWVFIHEKNYAKAFRQARSIDKKLDEKGNRLMDLGTIAFNAEEYNVAIMSYSYIVEEKGRTGSYYIEAKKALMDSKIAQIKSRPEYQKSDFDSLRVEYKAFIDEVGVNNTTAAIVKEYCDFLALDVNDINEAVKTLEAMVDIRSIRKNERADAKISLADFYLIQGDIWEATLLYSQVDKEFREEYLGEVARYKNALLFYYSGNFAWAQEIFDILKTSTSKLISNDAIDKSVFITTNIGLDSTDTALRLFAKSDLLAVQSRYTEAFEKLDSIKLLFPEHELEDDILHREALMLTAQQKYEEAVDKYLLIIEKFPEDITCDNAIFELAQLYDYVLDDQVSALPLYEKLFIDYSNSTFAVEARKRYRALRGDSVQ